MKKLFLLLAFATLAFASCSKDEGEDPKPSTYEVYYDIPNIDGITVTLTLFEYNASGESVATNTMSNCTSGTRRSFTANDKTTKVKVYNKFVAAGVTQYRWVQQVYYLNKGGNTNITISGTTMLGPSEP